MNLPNKLTVLRVILVPVFVAFMLCTPWLGLAGKIVSLIVFVVASLTDMLEGKIARKYNLVTNFGKFMDPLADKLLVVSALVCFIALDRIPAWIQTCSSREWYCHRCKLVGKMENSRHNDYDYLYDS